MLENSTSKELQQRINELEREAVEAKRSKEKRLTRLNTLEKAERALKETMDIVNRSPMVVFLWENEERWPVRFVSENVVDLFGYTPEAFISGKISYDATIHADELERVMDEVSRYSAEKGIQTFRIRFERKSQQLIPPRRD